jgi:hypothetical protein
MMAMLLFLLTSLKATTNALYNETRNAANDDVDDDDEDTMRMKFFALFRSPLSLSLFFFCRATPTPTPTPPPPFFASRRDATRDGLSLSLSLSTQKRDFLRERRDPKREKTQKKPLSIP